MAIKRLFIMAQCIHIFYTILIMWANNIPPFHNHDGNNICPTTGKQHLPGLINDFLFTIAWQCNECVFSLFQDWASTSPSPQQFPSFPHTLQTTHLLSTRCLKMSTILHGAPCTYPVARSLKGGTGKILYTLYPHQNVSLIKPSVIAQGCITHD